MIIYANQQGEKPRKQPMWRLCTLFSHITLHGLSNPQGTNFDIFRFPFFGGGWGAGSTCTGCSKFRSMYWMSAITGTNIYCALFQFFIFMFLRIRGQVRGS